MIVIIIESLSTLIIINQLLWSSSSYHQGWRNLFLSASFSTMIVIKRLSSMIISTQSYSGMIIIRSYSTMINSRMIIIKSNTQVMIITRIITNSFSRKRKSCNLPLFVEGVCKYVFESFKRKKKFWQKHARLLSRFLRGLKEVPHHFVCHCHS